MRVTIVSRIFEPEVSAASFRLAALARAFAEAGHEVTVRTVRPVASLRSETADSARNYRVKRASVFRDTSGYVRGYLQYMSFDIPLFFRMLFARKQDLIVVEPPPTTGFVVRVVGRLRRTRYAYYAADIWSDAAESTGASPAMLAVVRKLEQLALSGAASVLSVNDGVSARVLELAPRSRVHTVGNGIDLRLFSAEGARREDDPYVIYSGTASEWQGAGVFIEALKAMLPEFPNARLVFLGQGSDWERLQKLAGDLPHGAVEFVPTVAPGIAAEWLRGAVASVASIRPDSGYNFAFPTKVYASLACGTPVIYAGVGRVPEFFQTHQGEVPLGESVDYEVMAVAHALARAFRSPLSRVDRNGLGAWAAARLGLDSVASRAVGMLTDEHAHSGEPST